MSRQAIGTLLLIAILAAGVSCSGADSARPTPRSSATAATTADGNLTTAAYSDATKKITSDYGVEFRRMGTLVSNPGFDNPTWRQNLADVVASIKAIGARLRALQPPACLADVHAAQLDAASSYDQMADLLAAGVQNSDDNALLQSATFLTGGNAQIARAAELLGSAHC